MSSWNSARRKKYRASSSGVAAGAASCKQPSVPANWRARSLRVAAASGSGSVHRVAWGTWLESYSASAFARTPFARGASGSAAAPAARTGLRAIQYSWNQPICPSSHKGGFSVACCGTPCGKAQVMTSKVAKVSARLACSAAAKARASPLRAAVAASFKTVIAVTSGGVQTFTRHRHARAG